MSILKYRAAMGLSIAIASSSLLAPPPLRADPVPDAVSGAGRRIVVQTADLDLTTKQGLHRLDRRLEVAVFQICSDEQVEGMAYLACRRTLLDNVRDRREAVIAQQQDRKLALQTVMAVR